MKKTFILAASAAALLITSCSKQMEDVNPVNGMLIEDGIGNVEPMDIALKGSFVSDWESISSWDKKMEGDRIVFFSDRFTMEVSDEVLTDGAVLVFARDGMEKANMMAPFSQLGKQEAVRFPFFMSMNPINDLDGFKWFHVNSPRNIQVAYLPLNLDDQIHPKIVESLQFRFFVLDSKSVDFVKQRVPEIHAANYNDLAAIFNL